MKRIYIVIIVIVLALVTVGYFWLSGSNSKDQRYRTDKVTRGDIVLQVRATGTINPVKTVQVGSQVSGTLSHIFVDYNSTVKQGQIIAVIDSTLLYASVKEAQANLEHNQAQVSQTERDLKRTKDLFAKDLVSQADMDAATTAYESAIAQLRQTQAALDRVRVNLRYAIIRAPIDGVVISRDVDVGQTVAASLQTPKLFSIANDLHSMQVQASVDEADIGQVREGATVTFTVDAYPDEQFSGSVSQIRLDPVTVQNVVTYTVIVDVQNPDLKLRPGMTATVSILVDQRRNVLRVPALALRFQAPPDVAAKFKDQMPVDSSAMATAGRRDSSGRQGAWSGRRDSSGRQSSGGGGRGNWAGRSRGFHPGGRGPKAGTQMARLWILQNGRDLQPVTIRVGLNDNRYAEIMSDQLKEGDEIVIGMAVADMASGNNQTTNPFQSRMPGPGGGGRGGGR